MPPAPPSSPPLSPPQQPRAEVECWVIDETAGCGNTAGGPCEEGMEVRTREDCELAAQYVLNPLANLGDGGSSYNITAGQYLSTVSYNGLYGYEYQGTTYYTPGSPTWGPRAGTRWMNGCFTNTANLEANGQTRTVWWNEWTMKAPSTWNNDCRALCRAWCPPSAPPLAPSPALPPLSPGCEIGPGGTFLLADRVVGSCGINNPVPDSTTCAAFAANQHPAANYMDEVNFPNVPAGCGVQVLADGVTAGLIWYNLDPDNDGVDDKDDDGDDPGVDDSG